MADGWCNCGNNYTCGWCTGEWKQPMHEATGFVTKDSGKREELAGGMVRDVTEGKTDFSLILRGPLLVRWAELLTRGAVKYGKHNWWLGVLSPPGPDREATRARFVESAMRHMIQWANGDRTEDHAAAVMFNLNGFEAMLDEDKKL